MFHDSKFAGISLWWVGGAYFFLLAVLCLRGHRHLARVMAMLALFADAVLLVIMFLTAPCSQCLVVAVLMGLCYYTLKKPAPDGWFAGTEITPSLLLPLWFGLLLGNVVLAANEQVPLYAIVNTRSSESEMRTRIYFSPSCRACREAISHFGNSAILYPVMENEQDFDSIVRFAALLKANVPVREAVLRSINPNEPVPPLAFFERGALVVKLFRNKASLMRQGFRGLPLIQINAWQGEKPTSLERPAAPSVQRAPVPAHAPLPATPPDTSAPLQPTPPDTSAPPQGDAPPNTPPSPHDGLGMAAPDHLQPVSNGQQLPNFLTDPDALEQCGGDNPKPCN